MKINAARDFGFRGENRNLAALLSLHREFLKAMVRRLQEKDNEKGGWDDEAGTPTRFLELKLRESLEKGNMVDVANYAMFIWNRQDDSSGEQNPL